MINERILNNSPYRLDTDTSSDFFYTTVEELTDIILESKPDSITGTILAFKRYINSTGLEKLRSSEEYLIELLMIGIFWKNYVVTATQTSSAGTAVLKALYEFRRKNTTLKKPVDFIRGIGITAFLKSRDGSSEKIPKTTHSLKKLIEYLESSGDFSEEMSRLRNWYYFLQTYDKNQIHYTLESILHFADFFADISSQRLAKYTENVGSFIQKNRRKHLYKENLLFTSRPENEYHLNMVCAEILNRSFKDEFYITKKKIVLLPTCMQPDQGKCQSRLIGEERFCSQCRKECHINQITEQLSSYNIETRLIPHSSQFSQFLRKWRDNKSVGLVGIACVLNLIKGGYEMKNLRIPSQCVFLDYCGCKNHWHDTGNPTNLNLTRLFHILDIKAVTQ